MKAWLRPVLDDENFQKLNPMKTREIIHDVTFNAAPAAVFKALMDSKQHSQFTGAPAMLSKKVGGAFTCYNGYIEGVNLVLQRPRLIVQAWQSENWPRETWSIVTFKLSKLAGGRTKLSFTQIGVPAGDYNAKNKGWRTHYWEPLKKFLEKA
jgi:activator of HSP90 ATPase